MADLIKVSITGTMVGGETWSINPVYRINGAPQVVTPTECTTIAAAINAITIPTGFRSAFSSATQVTGCRVEARTHAGVLESLGEGARSPAVNGSGISGHPFQTSLVLSLRTPLAGASGRGRLYIPATGIGVNSGTLRPTSTDIGTVLTGAKQYLALIETAIEVTQPDVILAVWSRTLNTTLGVNRVQMGDVLDTQRRRRDAQIENYQELAIP